MALRRTYAQNPSHPLCTWEDLLNKDAVRFGSAENEGTVTVSGNWSSIMTRIRSGGDQRKFLRMSRDINFVKQHGRRFSTAIFNLLVCRTHGDTRVGIVVGRRFGTAVRRNRAKRLFRELTRQVHRHLVEGYWLLVFPKRDAITLPFESLKHAWCSTLKRQGVWHGDEA